jgi:hypothetical protein
MYIYGNIKWKFVFLVGKRQTVIDSCCFSKHAHIWLFITPVEGQPWMLDYNLKRYVDDDSTCYGWRTVKYFDGLKDHCLQILYGHLVCDSCRASLGFMIHASTILCPGAQNELSRASWSGLWPLCP